MKKLLLPFRFYIQQLKALMKKGTIREKTLFWLYLLFVVGLLLLSYTQADLGLVISRVPALYAIERGFQYIGYFQRPLSTELFCLTVLVAFGLYLSVWHFTRKKKISLTAVWSIIGLVAIVLTFSYNMLSYDLFNYIFDARIFTYYHANPYLHKAQDYPHDPMLGFMRWTDRTYSNAYGPVWLVLTIPLSYIGNHIFVITFYLFKLLMTVSYLGTVFFLFRLLKKLYPDTAMEKTVLFALNPLVLFECLVSSHNDIVMIFFTVLGLYLLMSKHSISSWSSLLASMLIKYATLLLAPAVAIIFLLRKKMTTARWQTSMEIMSALLIFAILLAVIRTEFQPWYLLYILVFLPFVRSAVITCFVVVLTFLVQLTYLPYLYNGDWNSVWFIGQEQAYYYLAIFASAGACVYLLYRGYRLAKR